MTMREQIKAMIELARDFEQGPSALMYAAALQTVSLTGQDAAETFRAARAEMLKLMQGSVKMNGRATAMNDAAE